MHAFYVKLNFRYRIYIYISYIKGLIYIHIRYTMYDVQVDINDMYIKSRYTHVLVHIPVPFFDSDDVRSYCQTGQTVLYSR